ncbi:translation initiation factor III [Couchioplanes azureus]|uniref:translation initiation factor III n=1 Tax=Couchioplanes caeruleus TaxID=56438 RepID=UPI00227D783E|nr:translation initiation factor III [Couchioplanes caeruleus]
MESTGGRTPPSKLTVALFGTSVVAALWAVMMLIPAGRVAWVYIFYYLEFYMGVVSLVSLSITIMVGLVSTDRLVLSIRQRLLLQSAHRTTGVMAISALGVHVWTKFAEEHIQLIDVFIPFLYQGINRAYVGFGTISGWIMVLVMWTGIARARFIGRGKPWMWRAVHSVSYLMWPIALLHGLNAGRLAATWVNVSYVVCVLGVLIGLAVRIAVSLNRRKDFASQAGTAGGTGGMKPVGKLTSTGPIVKGRGSRTRGDDPIVSDRAGAVEAWVPAAPPRAAAPAEPAARPVSPAAPAGAPSAERRPRRRVDEDERARRHRDYVDAPTQRWDFADEDDMPAARSRYADDAPAPRQRRAAAAERFDEPTRAISRRALEERPRRYADEEEMPAPAGRRRAGEAYEETPRPRARRYADTELEDEPAPRSRGRRSAAEDDAVPVPRGRRAPDDDPPRSRYADDEPAPPRRYADDDRYAGERYADDDRYADAPRRRAARYAEDDPPRAARPPRYGDDRPSRGTRSSRYAEDEDDAPRARRDRGADIDRADSGRHSRSEFVDLAGGEPAAAYDDPNYLEPDETPTLVDMAQRRARKATQQEPVRTGSGRGARRGSRSRTTDETADDRYWAQLRGEAQ